MSSLTNTQIKDTYQGLLKLADSTTGITSTFQAVQDGLGNDTGLRIATGQLESDNIPSFVPLKARYYGNGMTGVNATQYGAGTQNTLLATVFQDNGTNSYSAITFNTISATSTSDTVEFSLYTSQMINPFGLYPHSVVLSGITADTTTTGLKTFVFPTPISFSGYGAGIYWLVYEITNGGVQPTWRPSAHAQGVIPFNLSTQQYGMAQGLTTNQFQGQPRYNNATPISGFYSFSGLTTFANPFPSTITTAQSTSTSVGGNGAGFILHTVDA